MAVNVDMGFADLGNGKTRVTVTAQLKPKTLGARLIVQSAKLGRKRIQAKIDSKMVKLCNEIEAGWRRAQHG